MARSSSRQSKQAGEKLSIKLFIDNYHNNIAILMSSCQLSGTSLPTTNYGGAPSNFPCILSPIPSHAHLLTEKRGHTPQHPRPARIRSRTLV